MSALAITFAVIVTAAILWRQRRVRPFRPRAGFALPFFLGFLGLIELLGYTGDHFVSGRATTWLVIELVVAAPLLGAGRAATVEVWRADPPFAFIVRRATWLTMGLWAVTIALHFVVARWALGSDTRGLAWPSYLLFLAITYGAQRALEQARAQRFQQLGAPIDVESTTIGFDAAPPGAQAPERASRPVVIDAESELLPPRPDDRR